MLTVSQLLSWVLAAYDKHDDSYSDVENKHLVCKKQALIDLTPQKRVEGYAPNEGELELAVALIFSNTYQELAEMREMCYEDPYCEPCDPATPAPPPGDTMIRASWDDRSVAQPVPRNAYASAPITMAEVRERIEEHNNEILSRVSAESAAAVQAEQDRINEAEIDEIIRELEMEIDPNPPVMTTAEMGAHMAEVLSRPVPPECVIPMDLRISTESRP
jgi:hypothetical protein